MILKVKITFTIFAYCLTEIYTQDSPSCFEVDFNEPESIIEFEQCSSGNLFALKSYEDVIFDPYRPNVEYHLSNINAGISCFTTTQTFYIDEYTEFYSFIYLNSNNALADDFVDIQVFDTVGGQVYYIAGVIVSNIWNEFHESFGFDAIESAKVDPF